jgi:cellulose synthase/poly-beta-1,6-N-acetylglucosamine synthase-like glycosyltransferase
MGNPFELLGAGAALVLSVVAAGLAVLTAYLVFLTVAAIVARPTLHPPGPGRRRFAVLVPAHDEELTISRLLRSLAALDYSSTGYDVCVVADNCQDRTADIASAHDARVYERFSEGERAKGFALRWLLEQIAAEGRTYDAYVVLDADTVVRPDLLRRFDARLEAGSQVIQVYYTVLNARASAVAGLRFVALSALHYLRPLGRAALGLSCGLKGNGMCFSAPVLERFAWRWYTLAEDVEFHLALVREGIRVDFAWETSVLADMPVTLDQARTQNARWEQGRLQLLRTQVPRLILDGLRNRSLVKLDAAVEQLIPPLSVPVVLAGLCLTAGLMLGASWIVILAGLSVVGQLGYLAAGLVLVRAPWRAYVALSSAPVYIAWKFGLYAQALLSARTSAWIRTTRVPSV